MIKKISYATGVDSSAFTTPKKHENSNIVTIPVMSGEKSLAKYSINNLKANYLSSSANISFGTTTALVPYRPRYIDILSTTENVSALDGYKRFKSKYYNDLSNDLAILLGPGKNALLTHEDGVNSDLLIHNFTNNILDDKYSKEGLRARGTDVFKFNAEGMIGSGKFPTQEFLSIAGQNPHRKKVIFIENFHVFLMNLIMAGQKPEKFLEEGAYANTQIVGLMSKTMHDAIKQGAIEQISPKTISSLGRADFNGLGVDNTKDLLKKDYRFINGIFKRYDDQKIKISYNAIDELVDKASVSVGGSFPSKALTVLDLVTAAKLTEMKSDTGKAQITSSDVKNFFDRHSEIVGTLKPEQGQFTLAENVKTRLSDVGGISSIKEEINDDIIAYLKNPKKFIAERGKPPKGILMHGGPGTGKTLIARAIAGESGTPFIAASGSEFVEKFVGVGAQRVRELFATAKKAAMDSANKTAIVFIDEIDAIGGIRTGGSGGADEREATLNQLLTEMDGFNNKESKVKIIVLAATNREDMLDPALKRAGRFDSILKVPNPETIADRLEILNIHARKLAFASEADKAKILEEAAKITDGMSGADLADVMTKAAKVVSKRTKNKVITHNDMVEGFLQAQVGKITKSDLSDELKSIIVRHEGGHAVVIDTLKQDKVSFITLDGRGDFLGAVFHNKDKKTLSNFKSAIYSGATSYAGGLAEPNYATIGHSAGVSGDYEHITNIVQNAITKWGLGINTPQMYIPDNSPLYEMYKPEIKADTKIYQKAIQGVAKLIVDFHKEFLDSYVKKFEENTGKGGNNLSGEEFSKMRESWIKETGREKQYLKLQNKIEVIVKIAQNSEKSLFKRLLRLV